MNMPPELRAQLYAFFDSDLVNVSDANDVARAADEAAFCLTADNITTEAMLEIARYLRPLLIDMDEADISEWEGITHAPWSEYLPHFRVGVEHLLTGVEEGLRKREAHFAHD
jgi:hypothetical protein